MSWKLANFARLDPALKKRRITGASHGAVADMGIWNEFSNDWEKLAFESERLLVQFTGHLSEYFDVDPVFPEGTTRETIIRARVNQGFFRAAVLAAYGVRCCITGLAVPQLLAASHIVPWSVDATIRTNPRNGLCLNSIHDRAFDCGLLTVTPELKVRISSRIRMRPTDTAAREFLQRYDNATVSAPRRFTPESEFLRYHNQKIFLA